MLSKILLALNLCLLFGGLSVNTQFLGKNDAFHFLNKAVDPCVATCEEEPLAYKVSAIECGVKESIIKSWYYRHRSANPAVEITFLAIGIR